jgi:transcriptional regulator with XRE-family HTH domain
MKIGKKIKDLRIKYRYTQKELAAKVEDGIDYTYIGRIERDLVLPSLKTLVKLSDALNVDISYFFVEAESSKNDTVLAAIAKDPKKKKLLQLIYKLDDNSTQLVTDMIKLVLKHNPDLQL